jgi:D-glycero-alpha-D-manno-heptose 1-phosphate guanylyltransferase
MQAIILAGGFGTRLRSVLSDVPKPMAPVQGKPFLAHLITYLQTQGVTDVILSVHYLREQIESYFCDSYQGVNIQYAVEDEPLGTGGAIKHALTLVKTADPIFVLNGDTFLKMNYQAMLKQHQQASPTLTMALRKIADCSRYGVVMTENSNVTAFKEQGGSYPGLINAGVYLFSPSLFDDFSVPQQFSFERDFLFPQISILHPSAFVVDEFFIDIGIPEDYSRAQVEMV